MEIARRCFETFGSGDRKAFLELIHPDVEWRPALSVVPVDGLASVGTYKGHEGLQQWFSDLEQVDNYRIEPREFRDAGEHVVVIAGLSFMAGHDVYLTDVFIVFTYLDGKVLSAITYADQDEALKAAGLEQ